MLYVVFMGCLVPEQTSKNVYVYKTILLYLSLLDSAPAKYRLKPTNLGFLFLDIWDYRFTSLYHLK